MLAVVLVLSLIPLLRAACFSRPGPDDYRYGYRTHEAYLQSGSFGAVLGAAWGETAMTYGQWQGSFAAIFLMALEPGVFSPALYGISTWILVIFFTLGMLSFLEGLFTQVFSMERAYGWIGSLLITIGALQFVPYPCEALYWYNGSIYYTFFFSLSLLMGALLIHRWNRKSWIHWLFLPVLSVLIGGGNLVTGLITALLLFGFFGFSLLKKRKDPLLFVVLITLVVAFLINISAPGNGVRQAEHAESAAAGPLAAIWAGMRDAAVFGVNWLVNPASLLSIALIPLYWICPQTKEGRSAGSFRMPGLVTLLSFLLLAAGFTPTEYALSQPGEGRLMNIQYDLFLILLNLNLLWYTGWVKGLVAKKKALQRPGLNPVPVILTAAVGLMLAAGSAVVQRTGTSVSALRILLNGSAASYASQWETRYESLSGQEPALVFPSLTHKPPLLCLMDLTPSRDDPNYWYNQQVEQYYHKDSVLTEPLED